MIIWSGYGFLVPISAFAFFLILETFSEKITNDAEYYQNNPLIMYVGLILTAIICYFVGAYFNKNEGRRLIDKETGEEVIFKKRHTFFFIPIKYWAYILPVLGLLFFVKK
jgi:hypothetical protein